MIPPPHGFARAEDYIGYRKNITFWIDSSCVRSHVPRVPLQQLMPSLGQMLPNFREQLAGTERLRHVIITARCPRLIVFAA